MKLQSSWEYSFIGLRRRRIRRRRSRRRRRRLA